MFLWKVAELAAVIKFAQDTQGAEFARRKYDALFYAATDSVICIDSHGIILAVNHSMLKFFRYASDTELVGLNVTVLMPEPHASYHSECVSTRVCLRVARRHCPHWLTCAAGTFGATSARDRRA